MRAGYKEAVRLAGISIAVFLSMKYILPLLLPFLLAWLLVRMVMPAVLAMEKRFHIKRTAGGCVLLAALVALVCLAVYYLGTQLILQICSLAANFDLYVEKAEEFVNLCCQTVEKNTGIHAQAVEKFVYQNMNSLENRLESYTVPGMLKNSISYLLSMLEGLGVILIIFVSFVLLLKDYDEMRQTLEKYGIYGRMKTVASAMQSLGGAWLRAQVLIILAVTAVCVAGLWILGYPYALLLGIMIGLLDALPFIGTGTILLPWGLFLLFTGKPWYGVCLALLFLFTNALREFLEPKLMGDRLGVYPIAMVAAVYAGIRLYGVSGVILGPVSLMLIIEIYREVSGQAPGRAEP